MLISIASVVLISLSGMAVTYLIFPKANLLWRLCAGNVLGSAAAGLIVIVLSFAIGFSVLSVLLTAAILLLPLLLLRKGAIHREFSHDRDVAKGKTQGAKFSKVLRFCYYAFFLLLFMAFFGKAMIVSAEGIFTGASQNLGDLPFHLGAIFGFTEGAAFPPQNPSFAGAKFTYPFVADLLTACLVKLGAAVDSAMWVQNVCWAFSLLVILEKLVARLTGSRLAGRFAGPILFFSGGFGFMLFFKEYWNGTQGIWDLIWNLPKDYTIGDEFRWGNSLVTLFITQRSLLLGMPLTLLVIGFLWSATTLEDTEKMVGKSTGRKAYPLAKWLKHSMAPPVLIGLFAGTLPLIHAHSLAVLFVISAFWFFLRLEHWKHWIAFGVGVAIVAVPELLWVMSGSASRTSEFIGWHFGFDARGSNIVWFWLMNTGLYIPLVVAAFILVANRVRTGEPFLKDEGDGGIHRSLDAAHDSSHHETGNSPVIFNSLGTLLTFAAPLIALFVLANLFKLAPWEWDNIKVLIYWFVGLIPLVAGVAAWFWEKNIPWKALAVASLCALMLSGALDVWRTGSGQIRNQVFDSDAVGVAAWSRIYTERDSLFLNAPTYNSAVVLSGRRSLMRYIGHLSSHGIDYAGREEDLKKIYGGAPDADELIAKYGIDYVLISPRERESLQVNDAYFSKFEMVHSEGGYSVFKVGRSK